MEITRHLTATIIIVHKNKTLLLLHKKIGIWLPVGGHIEQNELPEEAALREAKEESGLDVVLYNPDKQLEMNDAKQLFRPAHILLESINEARQDIDFIYYATSSSDELNPQTGETTNLKWFTAEELKTLENVPTNVKVTALEALDLLNK